MRSGSRGVRVIGTRRAGVGPFTGQHLRGQCLFLVTHYGVSGPRAWPGSTMGWTPPSSHSCPRGGGGKSSFCDAQTPSLPRDHLREAEARVLWERPWGPSRGMTSPAFLLSPR